MKDSMPDDERRRVQALELAARFALIGEDPMISVARAELFYDFIGKTENAGSVR